MRVNSRGFLGRSVFAKAGALFWTGVGLFQSLRTLWELKPQAVVGVGGFSSGPVMGAAILLRIPTMIQEQNYSPGLANRILARCAVSRSPSKTGDFGDRGSDRQLSDGVCLGEALSRGNLCVPFRRQPGGRR
jgi:hypothetical protein